MSLLESLGCMIVLMVLGALCCFVLWLAWRVFLFWVWVIGNGAKALFGHATKVIDGDPKK